MYLLGHTDPTFTLAVDQRALTKDPWTDLDPQPGDFDAELAQIDQRYVERIPATRTRHAARNAGWRSPNARGSRLRGVLALRANGARRGTRDRTQAESVVEFMWARPPRGRRA
jgi:hypothetical protein